MCFSGHKEAVVFTDKKQKIHLSYYPAHEYVITCYTTVAGGRNRWHSMSWECDVCHAASLCPCV